MAARVDQVLVAGAAPRNALHTIRAAPATHLTTSPAWEGFFKEGFLASSEFCAREALGRISIMPRAHRLHHFSRHGTGLAFLFRLGLTVAVSLPFPAAAASLSAKDALIIVKALGFLEPAPAGGVVAILYGPDGASKTDAADIAGLFGSGLASSGGTVTAKPVDAAGLGDGTGYIAVIVAAGGSLDAAMAATKAHNIPCVTAALADVQAGHCVMSVQTDTRVVITVNRAVAQAVGVHFAASLAMLIHEI